MNISSNYDYSSSYNQTTSTTHTHKKHHTHTNPLDSLVSSGTITSDQEKAVEDKLKSAQAADNSAATSDGSTDSSTSSSDPLDSLVTSGTITKDQESSIKAAFEKGKSEHAHRMPPPQKPANDNDDTSNATNALTSTLSNLVTSGSITSDQKNTILTSFESAIGSSQTGTGTSSSASSLLDSLINSGTSTDTQETETDNLFQSAINAYSDQSNLFDQYSQDTDTDAFDAVM